MSGQKAGGTVTWDAKAGEYVQWHGRSREVAQAAAKQQDKPAKGGGR